MKAKPASTRRADLFFNPKGIGGSQTRRIRAVKGRFGPAGRARQLTADEKATVAEEMGRRGQLN
jgi:hypothetical protein